MQGLPLRHPDWESFSCPVMEALVATGDAGASSVEWDWVAPVLRGDLAC